MGVMLCYSVAPIWGLLMLELHEQRLAKRGTKAMEKALF